MVGLLVAKLDVSAMKRTDVGSILAVLRLTNGWDFKTHRDILNSLKAGGHLAFIRQIAGDATMHPVVRDYARSTLERSTEEMGARLLVEPVFRGLTPPEEARVRSSLERI